MRPLIALGRGLVHRAGTAAIILVVAVIATATAAAGPVYYRAAQHSILADVVSGAPFLGRGYEATLTGPVAGTLPILHSSLAAELDKDLGAAGTQRVFRSEEHTS